MPDPLPSPATPPLAPTLQIFGSGGEVTFGGFLREGVGFTGWPPRPSPIIITWFAPFPIGIVPSRYYGLPDDWAGPISELIDILEHPPPRRTGAPVPPPPSLAVLRELQRLELRLPLLDEEQIRAELSDLVLLYPGRAPPVEQIRIDILLAELQRRGLERQGTPAQLGVAVGPEFGKVSVIPNPPGLVVPFVGASILDGTFSSRDVIYATASAQASAAAAEGVLREIIAVMADP